MAKQKPNAPQTALKDGGEEALPSEAAILAFLKDNPETTSRREIARAFGIKGDQRRPFRERLKAMTEAGKIAKTKSKNYEAPDALPPVTVLTITALDADGDLVCEPLNWKGTAPPPPILLNDVRHGRALGLGDRILARLTAVDDRVEASVIRRLEAREKPRILGVFQPGPGGGTVLSVDKKARSDYRVDKGDTAGAKAGELVVCQLKSGRYAGPRPVKIVERLGRTDEPKSISLIAIHEHGLPFDFPDAVIAEAKAAKPVTL
ncbi:MAG: ribonuclease R, partial [Pseudomonadota bacterium]